MNNPELQIPQQLHVSVLLEETLEGLLAGKTHGVFVDATFGRGGHSQALLNKLDKTSRVIAFDKDPEAQAIGAAMAAKDSRLHMVHASFAEVTAQLAALDIESVDGIMADLGVSSPQLDDAIRGFSFMQDGPLDMRMDNSRGQTAAEFLSHIAEDALADILYQYGEERHSRRIARAIKQATSLTSTGQLAEIIKAAHPKWEKHKHPATRSFQAIRIALNGELSDLTTFLPQAVALLKADARLAVISFHSLEDRIVKQFIQQASTDAVDAHGWPIANAQGKSLKKISRVCASIEEVALNPRARSAWLRVAAKL